MDDLTKERFTKYLDSWLEFRRQRTEIPGIVVALSKDGETIYSNAFGYSDMETKKSMQYDSIFRIASHSKTFTATALMQLQERGMLRIDDRVVDYIPWLKEHKDVRYSKITIRQLMSHGAGIIRDGLEADYWMLADAFPGTDNFKKQILSTDLVFDTNIKMKYSNFGYTILGLVVEKASGLSYAQYIQENILSPLGLADTGTEFVKKIEERLATGYTRKEHIGKRKPIESNISTASMAPATGFYSTAENLLKYFNAHFVGSGKLLTDESKKEMQHIRWRVEHSTIDEAYGLGFEFITFDNNTYFGHGGGFPGTTTLTLCSAKHNVVCTVLVNSLDIPVFSINKAIITAYNYFSSHPATDNDSLYNGRFMNIWSISEIVALGSSIVITNPDTWTPFMNPSIAKIINDDSLKITQENSFLSEGEIIKFNRDNSGITKSIRYGMTQYTEQEYNQYINQTDKISMQEGGN